MSIANLLVPNEFNLQCNSLTANSFTVGTETVNILNSQTINNAGTINTNIMNSQTINNTGTLTTNIINATASNTSGIASAQELDIIATAIQNLIKFEINNAAATRNGILWFNTSAPNIPLLEVGYDETRTIAYINSGINSNLHIGTGDQETMVIEAGAQVDLNPRLIIAPFSGQTIGAVTFSYTHTPTQDNAAFLVEFKVTAYVTAGTAIGQSGVINRLTRMNKTGGVLTAVADLINTVSADAGIAGITSNITSSGPNIFVGVGGVAGQTIRWGGTVTIYQ